MNGKANEKKQSPSQEVDECGDDTKTLRGRTLSSYVVPFEVELLDLRLHPTRGGGSIWFHSEKHQWVCMASRWRLASRCSYSTVQPISPMLGV